MKNISQLASFTAYKNSIFDVRLKLKQTFERFVNKKIC